MMKNGEVNIVLCKTMKISGENIRCHIKESISIWEEKIYEFVAIKESRLYVIWNKETLIWQ